MENVSAHCNLAVSDMSHMHCYLQVAIQVPKSDGSTIYFRKNSHQEVECQHLLRERWKTTYLNIRPIRWFRLCYCVCWSITNLIVTYKATSWSDFYAL